MATPNMTTAEATAKLATLIDGIEFAMLTTVAAADGSLRSRPMATQNRKFDGTLWFFTAGDSGKVHEIADDQHVNLAYADPSKQNYVSVSGTARVVRDRTKIDELWTPAMKTWFPKGKDDPNVALLRVDADTAEYWDTPSSTMIHLYGMAKAALTGKSPDPGENRKVDLRLA